MSGGKTIVEQEWIVIPETGVANHVYDFDSNKVGSYGITNGNHEYEFSTDFGHLTTHDVAGKLRMYADRYLTQLTTRELIVYERL